MNHNEIVNFIWGVADLIRDTFKRGKYQDVILPLTVLRRIDCVLAPTKENVLKTNEKYRKDLENLDPMLRKASGYAFYNTSLYDFEKLLADAPNLASNLRNYIGGFSPNMREVLEKFDFDNTISKLDEAGLLFKVLERFKNVDLHPDAVDNHAMGSVFEELIRKFNEALNENPGEHFTPRDVVYLMAKLLIAGDANILSREGAIVTVYDPCCGTGGMLTITKEEILGFNPHADVHLFGQEVNPETFAVCKSDLFMKEPTGRDADNIAFGSTLSNDRHSDRRFDYLITNPPYGKDWKRDEEEVRWEHERGSAGRFEAGLPRISDGQLLFLQHMLSHMKPVEEGGSRVCIIMNGSPLFTGDAGSGESEIRRWVLENDWLDAIIALPEQLFYNTGIATYIWVLTNRKEQRRRGKVLLINATSLWEPMERSLGDKRRRISDGQAHHIIRLYNAYREREDCRIFPYTHFGYRKITVERPLRLNFQSSPERIARLEDEKVFQNLAVSKKKDPKAREKEEAEGRARQEAILAMLSDMPQDLFKEREPFLEALKEAERKSGIKLAAPLRKAILSALSERDETAGICRDGEGNPEPDPELRDTENVPLSETVEDYFIREVKPYMPDAWINEGIRDHKDGEVGKVGYEINFNRYFYKYEPPRPLEEIEADIRELEREITRKLREISR
ncbi:MAG: SAM-dependent DNA methyltransferase [Actinobacteria bacterium]|nr:SAM-dependent DNA methyltransferase [Actinomycetota bacterium]